MACVGAHKQVCRIPPKTSPDKTPLCIIASYVDLVQVLREHLCEWLNGLAIALGFFLLKISSCCCRSPNSCFRIKQASPDAVRTPRGVILSHETKPIFDSSHAHLNPAGALRIALGELHNGALKPLIFKPHLHLEPREPDDK